MSQLDLLVAGQPDFSDCALRSRQKFALFLKEPEAPDIITRACGIVRERVREGHRWVSREHVLAGLRDEGVTLDNTLGKPLMLTIAAQCPSLAPMIRFRKGKVAA